MEKFSLRLEVRGSDLFYSFLLHLRSRSNTATHLYDPDIRHAQDPKQRSLSAVDQERLERFSADGFLDQSRYAVWVRELGRSPVINKSKRH